MKFQKTENFSILFFSFISNGLVFLYFCWQNSKILEVINISLIIKIKYIIQSLYFLFLQKIGGIGVLTKSGGNRDDPGNIGKNRGGLTFRGEVLKKFKVSRT